MKTEPVLPSSVPTIGDNLLHALKRTATLRASDLHATYDQVPWIRQGGHFAPDDSLAPISRSEIKTCTQNIGGDNSSQALWAADSRWRVTAFSNMNAQCLAFRRIASNPPPIEQLGISDEVRTFAGFRSGLIIVAGATGSGKSTTLAALINLINETRPCHIMTLEDPIEYIHEPKMALINQREVPSDASMQALLTAMRADPDVVLIGECRTRAQFEVAMEMAATGHLVLTTLHARDCVSTCERITAACGDQGRQMLSQTLKAVIAQRLIPSPKNPRERFCAAEIMTVKKSTQNMIKPGQGKIESIHSELDTANKSFDKILAGMVREGKILYNTAMNEATNQEQLATWLRG